MIDAVVNDDLIILLEDSLEGVTTGYIISIGQSVLLPQIQTSLP